MSKFVSLLRKPDFVYGATESTILRFEEDVQEVCPVKYDYVVENGVGKVIVYPSEAPVKYLKFRFSGDMSKVEKVFGEHWERTGIDAYAEWRSIMANRILPWYTVATSGKNTLCYGVKTGANCFAFFQIDPHGVTLFMNLCCGNDGTDLKEAIVACEVKELFEKGKDVFDTTNRFCKMLCDNPVVPKEPIFGLNNWYWAYGDIDYDCVLAEAESLKEFAKGCKHRPYMIVDDGWQIKHKYNGTSYNGGPWEPNEKFKDMKKLADDVHAKGSKIGIWFRPLLTLEEGIPEEAIYIKNGDCDLKGDILDPSHPFTIKKVFEDARKIRSWGFDLIKHDFTCIDLFGISFGHELRAGKLVDEAQRPGKLYDRTKTNAMILKTIYQAIQDGADGAEVITCNVIGHLSAGISSTHRVGNDTSGIAWEWTRLDGVNSVMRLPQNYAFYNVDPDCAAFTEKVKSYANFDFLEMCALTGMTTLASVTPNLLTKDEIATLNRIFRIADENKCRYKIKDFANNSNPEVFVSPNGKDVKVFDWTKCYNGARCVYEWME